MRGAFLHFELEKECLIEPLRYTTVTLFKFFVLKTEVFNCFMLCGKSAPICFQSRLESLLQKTWSESLGLQMNFF